LIFCGESKFIQTPLSFLPSSHSSKTHFVYIRKKYCFDKTDRCNYSKKAKSPKFAQKTEGRVKFLFVCLLLLLTRLDSSWINKTLKKDLTIKFDWQIACNSNKICLQNLNDSRISVPDCRLQSFRSFAELTLLYQLALFCFLIWSQNTFIWKKEKKWLNDKITLDRVSF